VIQVQGGQIGRRFAIRAIAFCVKNVKVALRRF
jgi:hypothetical protein